MRERQERAHGDYERADDEDAENQNVQIIKLISALGGKDGGRRAILKAMAVKQGISSDQDIDDIMNGSAERRLQVPAYLRNVMKILVWARSWLP